MKRSYPRIPLLCAIAVSVGLVVVFQPGTAAPDSTAAARFAAAARSTPGDSAVDATSSTGASPASSAARSSRTAPAPGVAKAPRAAAPATGAAALSLTQLAGQRVIYSYSGLTPPSSLLGRIRLGQAAGVILFGGNISSPSQIRAVINELQQANKSSPVHAPLLILTDQEGGLVRRLPGAPLLSEKQIGKATHPWIAATDAGTGAGQNLRGVGVNVNLAPVLDVFRTPGDFIDEFQRSYSSHPSVVSALGARFIAAQQLTGVAATAKHFPGLGPATTTQNTDAVPVTLRVSLSSLRATDEAPYPAAIAAGVRLIMVSWAVYPALDAHRPAGLSAIVVTRELRGRLGFKGVTVTDAIEAGALRNYGTLANRGVLAAGAGMDLVLFSGQNVNQGISGLNGLVSALRSGRLGTATFTAAAQRVMALRATLPP
jgi:beta-N-acetylhexosaminidase